MKQHLRFFTLALLCAMCTAGWGKTKTYSFLFSSTAIPTGKTPNYLSEGEWPNTYIMFPNNYASEKMRWIFDIETDAPNPIYCRYLKTWLIGEDDKNGEIKHVKKITLKLLGYFKNVTDIHIQNPKFSNTNGKGTLSVKIGDTVCGKKDINDETGETIDIANQSPVSGQVEITIEQPETTYQFSMKQISFEADDLEACELSYVGDTEYSLDLKETSFTAPELRNPNNLDISYYSTNPALAAVDEATGEVTLGQANGGTATIYAFFNGNDTYKFGYASYTLNVDSKPLWSEDFSSGSLDGYTVNNAEISNNTTNPELLLSGKGSFIEAVVDLQGLYGDFLLSFKCNASTYSVSVSDGDIGKKSKINETVTVSIENIPKGTKRLTVTIKRSTKDLYIDDISLTGGTLPKNPVCWMTYCSPSALDFTEKADYYNAYIATSYKSDGNVGLTKIEKVPAGMGILVKSLNPRLGTFIFDPASVVTTEPIEQGEYTNLLQGVTDDYNLPTTGTMTFNGEEVACTNFILAQRDGVVGFYKSAGGTLKAKKAYLQLPTDLISGSNSISFYVEDGTTAIQNVTTHPATTDDAWYTLQGVRVAQPTHGLYIHNGKKVVVK